MKSKLWVVLETSATKEHNGTTKIVFTIIKWLLVFLQVFNHTTLTARERESDRMNLRIRKLVPLETLKLMGFERKDEQAMREQGMSDMAIYHCAGDSIVTTCLMAIFGQMLLTEEETQKKINDYVEGLVTE